MSHVVVKPFKTINRKFKEGDTVAAADIDAGNALSFEDYVSRGLLAEVAAEGVAERAPRGSSGFGFRNPITE